MENARRDRVLQGTVSKPTKKCRRRALDDDSEINEAGKTKAISDIVEALRRTHYRTYEVRSFARI